MNPTTRANNRQAGDVQYEDRYATLYALPEPAVPLPKKSLHELISALETTEALNQSTKEIFGEYIADYRTVVETIPDLVYSVDERGIIVLVNKAVNAYGYSVEEIEGVFFADLIYEEDREYTVRGFFETAAQRKKCSHSQKFRIVTKSGELRWLEANCSIHFTLKGDFIWQEGVCRDITEIIEVQRALLNSRSSLEEEVRKRTSELTRASLKLQKEILERGETERALREREKDLEQEKANLQEANTALKVLLKRRDRDKHAFEERILLNVSKMVLPYLQMLSEEIEDDRQKIYLRIMETNLQDITSDFSRKLSIECSGLTKAETRVAMYIRHGMRNRQIAELLGLSVRTVEAYRMSIRDKLKINRKKVNLCTYLKSMG